MEGGGLGRPLSAGACADEGSPMALEALKAKGAT